MKTLTIVCAFVVLITTANANIHINPSNIHKNPSIEYRTDSPQSFVGLNTQDKARSEHIKISNGTGDPVMHGAVLGTVTMQTGIFVNKYFFN